jgi:uncharacterized protein
MTNEERDLIARYIARVGGAPQAGGGFLAGSGSSVPQSQPLPPIDREADTFIAQQFQQYPEARYRVTQMAIVQEAALAEMNNRIQRLQWELEQARHAIQSQPQQSPQQRGFFSSLFGGGGQGQPQQPQQSGPWGNQGGGQRGYPGPQFQPSSPPPQPQYPPNYQPGMFQQRGSGFLGSALTTAAGVAGGMVVGNALMNAFSGHQGAGAPGGGLFGSNTSSGAFDGGGVVPTSDPTSGFGTDASYGGGADPFSQGGEAKSFDDGGYSQNTGFDQGGGGGFDQGGFDPGGGGGFDSGGGGFDSGGFDSGSGSDSA